MSFREMTDHEGVSAGRFVPAASQLLPPIRNTKIGMDWENAYHFSRIAGGRFVPAADELLPPVREATLGIDYDNAYHFNRLGRKS